MRKCGFGMQFFNPFRKTGAFLLVFLLGASAQGQTYSSAIRYDLTPDQRQQVASGDSVEIAMPGPVAAGVPEGASITGFRLGLRVQGLVEWIPDWKEEPASTLVKFNLPYRVSARLGSSFAQRAGQINAGPLRVKPGLEEKLQFSFDRPLFDDAGEGRITGGQISLRHVAKVNEDLRIRLSSMGGWRTSLLVDSVTDQTFEFSSSRMVAEVQYEHRLVPQIRRWGQNPVGQLGTGEFDNTVLPTRISGLSNIRSISTGEYHNLALDSSQRIWGWGRNRHGQLGIPGTESRLIPEIVPMPDRVKWVITGSAQSFAMLRSGKIYAWGLNFEGQLGLGDTIDRSMPTEVPALSSISQLAVGSGHAIALTKGGRVLAFGKNTFGQLGLVGDVPRLLPTLVPGGESLRR